MSEKNMKLRPGDKVRISQDAVWGEMDPDLVTMTAPQGSIATVLSYNELSDYLYGIFRNDQWRLRTLPSWLALQKGRIEAGTHYAIRFEKVVRPSEEELAYWEEEAASWGTFWVNCEVGGVEVLTIEYLEKITEDEQGNMVDNESNENAA